MTIAPERTVRTLCSRTTAIAVLSLLAGGCAPKDPLDTKVVADTTLNFSMWQTQAGSALAAEQRADFSEAIQEIRFRIMAQHEARGSEAIEEEMQRRIDGRTVRYVLELGLGWELVRAEDERSLLQDSIAKNAQMMTRPGDTASANYLADLHDRQTVRLKAASAEVAHVRERLAAANLPVRAP